jgi:hypothetical protein
MAISLNFKQDAFSTSGIAMMQSKWTLAECEQQAIETGEDQLQHLASFANAIGCGETDVILTCYQGSDQKIYFNLPAVLRDKEGALVMSFGEQQIPLVFENGYTVNGVAINVDAIRDKDNKLIGVKFVLPVKMEFDGLDETVEFNIGVRLVPESDYKQVVKALKVGETPESVKQMGTGFRLTLKPFMLPPGEYKLMNYKTPPSGEWSGKIWSGDCRNMETGETFTIELSTKPFKENTAFMDVCSGKTVGKGIYFMIEGGFDLGENKTSALINALQLKEVDGQVVDSTWQKFVETSKAAIHALRQQNQGKILSPEDIAAKREALEAKQLAKMAAKKDAVNATVPLERNPQASEENFDEIPF